VDSGADDEVSVMRKLLFPLVGVAALCVPAVSVAGGHSPSPMQLAVQSCRSIRAQDGKQTFKQVYHSFAGCLKQQKPQASQDVHNAAQTCKSERSDPNFAAAHDGKTFDQYYGTNGGNGHGNGAGKNAFGKCVSTLAKQNATSDVSDSVSAAETCKTLQQNDPATFQSSYGSGRNAFGKCVSKQSQSKNG
jgi:hypothetical protein